MTTLWIGDFRSKQIQLYKKATDLEMNYEYLLDDTAEYSWFNSGILEQLYRFPLAKEDSVVIMLGFNDCAYSCIWEKAFNIEKIATKYATMIDELCKIYPDVAFYVCSVNPVDSDYPFAEHPSGTIPRKDLLKAIELFNKKLQESCKSATYINTYRYLTATNFCTTDGIRMDYDTTIRLTDYILLAIRQKLRAFFDAKITADRAPTGDPSVDGLFWLSDKHGGFNPYPANPGSEGHEYSKGKGDTLPNCTAWAWGRFYEILGKKPALAMDFAERWWNHVKDGYKRGQTPAVGAVICWQSGPTDTEEPTEEDGAGHVAIVEQVNADGSIIISESGYEEEAYWWTKRCDQGGFWQEDGQYRSTGDNTWGYIEFEFQGFIYCPTTTRVTKQEIRSVNSWSAFTVDDEMKKNATYIWQYFGSKGWSANAVAALLGNLQKESGMSPSIWEGTIAGSIINADSTHSLNKPALEEYYKEHDRYPGYGLVQWTPYSKYTNWCTSGGRNLDFWDIDSQLERINWEAETGTQWGLAYYNENFEYKGKRFTEITFNEFKTSTYDPNWLAAAFAFCYEKPSSSTPSSGKREELCRVRGGNADFWYSFISELPFGTAENCLYLGDIKIDKQFCDGAQISFLIKNAAKVSYIINDEKPIVINTSDDFTTFVAKDLVPNKKYSLTLVAEGIGESSLAKRIDFETLQALPESITSIKLLAADDVALHSSFMLEIPKNDIDFGYWKNIKKKSCGYTMQLIVNGVVKCEKVVNSLPTKFSINDYFGANVVKLGDIVQVGIRTWVNDAQNHPVFDGAFAKMSNPIPMLLKPIKAHLLK